MSNILSDFVNISSAPNTHTSILLFIPILIVSFFVGKYFKSKNLPTVTGYIVTGLILTSFILTPLFSDLFGFKISETIYKLPLIDLISKMIVTFIGIVAGSEFNFKAIKPTIKPTLIIVAINIIITITIFSLFFYLMIPILSNLPMLNSLSQASDLQKLAISFLVSATMLCGSASATIAIFRDTPIRNYFTTLSINIIVILDIVASIVFAIFLGITNALFKNIPIDSSLVCIILMSILSSIFIGLLVGFLVARINFLQNKIICVVSLLLVFGIYVLSAHYYGESVKNLTGLKNVELENVLVFISAGTYLQNFSKIGFFIEETLGQMGKYMFLILFTYVGIGIRLETLFNLGAIIVVLFLIRNLINLIGTYLSSKIIVNSTDNSKQIFLLYNALVSKGGIMTGFAKTIKASFGTTFGPGIYDLIVSFVIISQITGPILFKKAILGSDKLSSKSTAISIL